jgi:Na+/melibiose symporter-like transporter
MTKELIISLSFGGAVLLALIFGIFVDSIFDDTSLLSIYVMITLVCVVGQIVMAHLAFNQYKNLSTQTPNEGQENDREERSDDGFDD